jgi:hypothetical protein
MLLTMVILLALSSAFLEVKLAKALPIWHKMSVKSQAFNLLGSIALSYVLGMLFGASGLIALMAGIVSTVITVPYYSGLRYIEDNETKVTENVQIVKDAGRGIWFFVKFIGFPFRVVRKITQFFARKGATLNA